MRKSVHLNFFINLSIAFLAVLFSAKAHAHTNNEHANRFAPLADKYFCDICGKYSDLDDCDKCKGKGKVGTAICTTCNGTGQVYKDCGHAWNGASSNKIVVKELVFTNGQLIKGTNLQDGAEYKYDNAAPGIDVKIKINKRSSKAVTIHDLDVTESGWNKAFQPQIGVAGGLPANGICWVEFEMTFFKAGTSSKMEIDSFYVTALDVDGDGQSLREFVQMDKASIVKYSPVTYLKTGLPIVSTLLDDIDNTAGTDFLVDGPIDNFANIDTNAKQVMATYIYVKKSSIKFKIGNKKGRGTVTAKVAGTPSSIALRSSENSNMTAGRLSTDPALRLNSVWFKSFETTIPSSYSLLPVNFTHIAALLDKDKVTVNWSVANGEDINKYVVERGTDGIEFVDVATVLPANKQMSFAYNDKNITSSTGLAYYRIRSVDASKEILYSPTQVVHFSQQEVTAMSLSLYPNPVVDQANINIPSQWQGKKISLEIFSASGLKLQEVQLNGASQTETMPFNNLAKGLYIVKAICEGQTAQQRIVKN